MFYEKIIQSEYAQRADFIEDVVAGIGGALGGYDKLLPMLEQMRK